MIHDFYSKIKKHLPWVLVVFLVSWGIYWRASNWQSYSLGFDQVQILTNAEQITKGQLTLIGPRTGPAATFTGPLIYYLTALVQLFSSPILSALITPIILALLTGLSLFFLTKHYFNYQAAITILAIWATAPLLLYLDRIFWNPNLSLLAFCLAFLPILLKKKAAKLDLFLVFIGAFLSYQAHFSAFILMPIVGFLVIFFRLDKKYFLFLSLGFVLSLLPTFLFDLRHDWLNWRGLLSFGDQQGEKISMELIFNDVLKNSAIVLETLAKLFYQLTGFSQRVVLGTILFIGASYLFLRQKKLSLWPSLSVLALIIIFFSFYQGAKPEYYFLITLPTLFVLIAQLASKAPPYLLFSIFFVQLLASRQFMLAENKNNLELTLGNCLKIQQTVQEIQSDTGISFLAYDLAYATDFGLKYLLEPIDLKETGVIVHLLYPAPEEVKSIKRIGRTAIIVEEKYK